MADGDAPRIRRFIGEMLTRGSSKLSRAAMETLAIIAYRQPITAPEIEAVRGVSVGGCPENPAGTPPDCRSGPKATLGRPMLYVTTPDFLHYFALADLAQLPPLEADMPAPLRFPLTSSRTDAPFRKQLQKRLPKSEIPHVDIAVNKHRQKNAHRLFSALSCAGLELC